MAVTRAVTAAALHLRGSGWLCSEPLAHVIVMACYTAEDVAHLFEEDGAALDSVCMDGSDDELGLEDVEIVQNPYYHHTAEFDDFEEVQGR